MLSVFKNPSGWQADLGGMGFVGQALRTGRMAFLSALLVAHMVFAGAHSASATGISGKIDPSEVHALWQEINTAILLYARLSGVEEATLAQIEAVEPEAYTEKQPKDVYARVEATRGELVRQLGNGLVSNTHGGTLLEEEIIRYMTLDGETVTPLTVYLRSLFLYESLIKTIAAMDPELANVSEFFDQAVEDGRRPGDVFILVGMAQERLKILALQPQENEGALR